MVQLDYRTINRRWGLRGIEFSSWQSYTFALGYLTNPMHNYELNKRSQVADLSPCVLKETMTKVIGTKRDASIFME